MPLGLGSQLAFGLDLVSALALGWALALIVAKRWEPVVATRLFLGWRQAEGFDSKVSE